jgi:type VI secretion system protein ImpA
MSAPILAIDADALLAPPADTPPAGPDLRYLPIFDDIKNARKLAEAEPGEVNPWKKVADLVSKALTRSKDLQLGIWLTESLARVDGYRGTATGIVIVRRLLVEHWDGLYPHIDPDDSDPVSFRRSLLEWIDRKLPEIVKLAPVTAPPASYGLLHYEVTQKTGDEKRALLDEGWPASERFEEALQNSSLKFLEDALQDVMTAEAELAALQSVTDQRFNTAQGPGSPEKLSYSFLKDAFETAHWLVERPIKRAQDKAAKAAAADGTPAPAGTADGVSAGVSPNGDQLWNDALTLTRNSSVEGLRLLQSQVASAGCGRDRFLRQLQFGELCLEAGVHALAFPIFDDLARTIDSRQLVEWEDKVLIARTWRGLVRCCRLLNGQPPSAASRAQEIQDRLNQLDPSLAAQT